MDFLTLGPLLKTTSYTVMLRVSLCILINVQLELIYIAPVQCGAFQVAVKTSMNQWCTEAQQKPQLSSAQGASHDHYQSAPPKGIDISR